jgi:hypothetical protein
MGGTGVEVMVDVESMGMVGGGGVTAQYRVCWWRWRRWKTYGHTMGALALYTCSRNIFVENMLT